MQNYDNTTKKTINKNLCFKINIITYKIQLLITIKNNNNNN